eukprot:11190152-Alexandrium_andersonii.AAC.1
MHSRNHAHTHTHGSRTGFEKSISDPVGAAPKRLQLHWRLGLRAGAIGILCPGDFGDDVLVAIAPHRNS